MNITAHIGKKMKLDNGTVVLDIQRTFSSELDESGVVLISLQFESGLYTSSLLFCQFLVMRVLELSSRENIAVKNMLATCEVLRHQDPWGLCPLFGCLFTRDSDRERTISQHNLDTLSSILLCSQLWS